MNIPVMGHYSTISIKNNRFFLSGLKAWNADGTVTGSIEEQTAQIFLYLEHILSSNRLSFSNIDFIQVFLANIDDYDRFNQIYSEKLKDSKPARAVLGAILRANAKIEIIVQGSI